ncbi:RNA polymerase sigma factor [Butyrivibrio proteoclasticus]|uniref:RNA polymerase sigma factor n=1 Tax=Butyrivibrio proteoclasticus TaxID=43305 RepID=UPI00047D2C7D|nr:sigma factor-like helix-turn-helix DNA-binding protein [Butyrivibrio proteoclasticus]
MKNNDKKITLEINDPNAEYYITIKGVEVRCSKEVYLTIKRPMRKEAMRKYRGQRPFINGTRCKGTCKKCPNYAFGSCSLSSEVSLDKLFEDDAIAPISSLDVSLEAECNVLIEKMFHELDDEDPKYKAILSLMIQELSQREIASQLNMANGTVTYYIKRIRAKLDKFRE